MITTRRQIVNENDRYGGYSTQPVSRVSVREEDSVDTYRAEPVFSRATAITETEKKNDSFYSGRPSSYPETAEFIGSVPLPKRQRKTVVRETEDIMPSIKTRAYLNPAIAPVPAAVEFPKKKERVKLEGKTKAMLFVYAAIVTVIAIAVIITGVAISSATAEISDLQNEIGFKNSIIAQQNAELNDLANETTLTGAATDLGMIKVDNIHYVDLLPIVSSVEYKERTNWFDRFCDWLSNIIGG